MTWMLLAGLACFIAAINVCLFGSIEDVKYLTPIYATIGTTIISAATRVKTYLLNRRIAVLRAQIAEAERILAKEQSR